MNIFGIARKKKMMRIRDGTKLNKNKKARQNFQTRLQIGLCTNLWHREKKKVVFHLALSLENIQIDKIQMSGCNNGFKYLYILLYGIPFFLFSIADAMFYPMFAFNFSLHSCVFNAHIFIHRKSYT